MNPQPTDHIVDVNKMVSTDTMSSAFEKVKAQRDEALAASRWETDLCAQALAELKLMTSENDSLKAELAALRAQQSQGALDAARYRWLTEDHYYALDRLRVQSICEGLPARSYASTSASVDAAMKAQLEAAIAEEQQNDRY